MEQFSVYDEYNLEHTLFQIGKESVLIKNDRLAEALSASRKRNAILFLCIGFWIWLTVRLLILLV